MNCTKRQQHRIKFQLIFMWLYIFVIYLPFFVFMITNHNVNTTSMSSIGWITGGIQYLFLYLVIVLPFGLYQIFFFNRYFINSNTFINAMSSISCSLIAIGAFIPVTRTRQFSWGNFIHNFMCIGGSVFLILTIFFALILHSIKKKHKRIIFILYGIYFLSLLIAFSILRTAAIFQLSATLSFFLVLLFVITTHSILQQKTLPTKLTT